MNKYILFFCFLFFFVDSFSQINVNKKITKKEKKAEKKAADLARGTQLFDQGVRLMGKRLDYYSTWTERGAKTVPLYEIHFSAMSASRWGNFPDTEISSNLLLLPVVPNIALKHKWLGRKNILSSQHSFYYPSMMMRYMAKKEIGDILSKDSKIPSIYSFRNEIIFSSILNYERKKCFFKIPDLILTLRLGIDKSFVGKSLYLPIVNNSLVYARSLSARTGKIQYFFGAELAGNLYKAFNYSISADYFTPFPMNKLVAQGQLRVHWHKSSRFSLSAGCKVSYTNADIKQKISFLPLLNFVFKIRHQQTLQRGLF